MSESESERRRRVARAVREACVEAVIRGYEDAAIAGLCHEGAVEASVSAVRMVDVEAIVAAAAEPRADGG